MPINDQTLDALDQLDDAGKLEVLGALSDDERSQVMGLIPQWKARKAQPQLGKLTDVSMVSSDLSTAHVPTPAELGEPPTEEPGFLSRGLNAVQDFSKRMTEGQLGIEPTDTLSAVARGVSDVAFPLTSVTRRIGGAPALLGARAAQGANPTVPEDAFENEPAYAAARQLEEVIQGAQPVAKTGLLGPLAQSASFLPSDEAAAALQFAAQVPGAAISDLGAGTLLAAKGATLAPQLAKPVGRFFVSGVSNTLVNAAQAPLSAPEGRRAEAAWETATDPRMLALTALGGVLAARAPVDHLLGERVVEPEAPSSSPPPPPTSPLTGTEATVITPRAEVTVVSPKPSPERTVGGRSPERNAQARIVQELNEAEVAEMIRQADDAITQAEAEGAHFRDVAERQSAPERQAQFLAAQAKTAELNVEGGKARNVNTTKKLKGKPTGALLRESADGGLELAVFREGEGPLPERMERFPVGTPVEAARAARLLHKSGLDVPFVTEGASKIDPEIWHVLVGGKDRLESTMKWMDPQRAVINFDPNDKTAVVHRADTDLAALHKVNARGTKLVWTPEGYKYAVIQGNGSDVGRDRTWIALPIPDENLPTIHQVTPIPTEHIQDLAPDDMRAMRDGRIPDRLVQALEPDLSAKSAAEVNEIKKLLGDELTLSQRGDIAKRVGLMTKEERIRYNEGDESVLLDVGDRIPAPPPPPDIPHYNDPVPPPPAQPPRKMPPHTGANLVFAKLMEKDGLLIKAQNQLVADHLLGPELLREYVQQNKALNDMRGIRDAIKQGLKAELARVKAKPYSQMDIDLGLYTKGKKTAEQMAESYGPAWARLQQSVDEKVATIRSLEQDLKDLGALEGDAAIKREAVELYVTREFHNNRNKAEWQKILKKRQDIVSEAVTGSKEWWSDAEIREEKGADVDPRLIREGRLFEMIGGADPVNEAFVRAEQKPSALNALRKRNNQLPDWYLKLLGEEESGIANLAATIGKQLELKARFSLYKEMANDPSVAVLIPTNKHLADGWLEVPKSQRRVFGDLAGHYVSPEVRERITTLPQVGNVAQSMAEKLYNISKQHKLGVIPMLIADIASGPWQMAMSGIAPVSREMAATLSYMPRTIADWKAYLANPLSEKASIIKDAIRLGVKGRGGYVNAVELRTELDALRKHMGVKPDLLTSITRPIREYLRGANAAHRLMDVLPTIQRISAWRALTDKAMRDPSRFLSDYVPGEAPHKVKEAAMRWAADKVAHGFYTPDKVAPLVERSRRGMTSFILNPFISYKADMIAKTAMLPKRYLSEPALRNSLHQVAALVGGIYANLKLRDPISDDEQKAAEAQRSPGARSYSSSKFQVPLRMDNGELALMDLAPIFEPLSFLGGDPRTDLPVRLADTLTNFTFGGGAGEGPVRWMLGNTVDRSLSMTNQQKLQPDQATAFNAADYAMRNLGAVPQSVPRAYDALVRGQMLGNKLTWKQDVASPFAVGSKIAGLPLEIVRPGGNAATARTIASVGELKEILMRAAYVASLPDEKAMPMLAELGAALGLTPDRKASKQQALQRLYEAAAQKAAELQQASETFGKVRQQRSLGGGQ